MSRKGKEPITLPKGVEVQVNGNIVRVKGPKGTSEQEVKDGVQVDVKEGFIQVSLNDKLKKQTNWHGLFRTLIHNMIVGTTEGFETKLELIGVGYRAAVKGQQLELQVGFSFPITVDIPEGIQVKVEKTTVTLNGINKQAVGQFAADIRQIRPPEPYKGKGIRYVGEHVRRKQRKGVGK